MADGIQQSANKSIPRACGVHDCILQSHPSRSSSINLLSITCHFQPHKVSRCKEAIINQQLSMMMAASLADIGILPTFGSTAAEAAMTLAIGRSPEHSSILPVLLYSDARRLSALEMDAAAAAASAFCLTSGRVDSSRLHCRRIAPSAAADCPSLGEADTQSHVWGGARSSEKDLGIALARDMKEMHM